MAVQATTQGEAPATTRAAWLHFRPDLWSLCAAIAITLLVVAFFLPLWHMTLIAPQYPQDLQLTAYGTTMKGDLQEINTLNHYAGVKQIVPGDVLELKAFPFLLFGFVAAIAVAAVLALRRLRWAVVAVAWAFPIGFLIDLQDWLWKYGHDLNEEAPLYPGPFTPKVLGRTKVVNFHSETMVSTGFWLMVAAAIMITFGPWLIRFLRDSWKNTGTQKAAVGAAVMVLTLGATVLLAEPTPAHAQAPAADLNALVAAAAPGSTLRVPAGTYAGPVTVDKPLTLEGVGWPVIDGGRRGDVVRITADGVTLRGFLIQSSARDVSDEPTGIRLLGDHAIVEGNRLRDVLYGITLHESNGHVVRNNDIESVREFETERRGHALYLYYTTDNVLSGNHISFAKDGLYVNFSERNLMEQNVITDSRYGVHFMYADNGRILNNVFTRNLTGGSVMYSKGLYFEGNEFSYNRSSASGYGISFKDVDAVELVGNSLHHNQIALTMEGAPITPTSYLRLRHNLIGYNGLALYLSTTVAADFTENTFTGNLREVESRSGSLEHHNTWAVDGRGNYWDQYSGYDANGDGAGDIAYRYRSAYGDLMQRETALRAYLYTPAQAAVDLAARFFPVYQNAPSIVDPHPLMRPTMKLPSGSLDAGRPQTTAILALLLLAPLATFVAARERIRGRC
ncbi:MAG: nitrous oxide reductase family maturation protein NosD [Dehalococcoidia bacterium]|nr:nitrous oxide reductase family maturation protein NosD [Dehalococcoidia bacterium]